MANSDRVTTEALATLRSPLTIRARCKRILEYVEAGHSAYFSVDAQSLDGAADRVARLTESRFPDRRVPGHSRWRHFEAGGIDRHGPLRRQLAARGGDRHASTRALVDLAVVSVLLDAGAGAAWCYREATSGLALGRSEGLAIASLDAFLAGRFSSDPGEPWRVDGRALQQLQAGQLADLFQVTADNPLVGLEGRARLMNALGSALLARPDLFGAQGRPGGLVDALDHDRLSATALLDAVLTGLSVIWPSGQQIGGVAVGDCWRHPAALDPDPAGPDQPGGGQQGRGQQGLDAGWVPFHKLSQWLTYSLIEPFEWAGIRVAGSAALTGLPEYRNGGLLLDCGVLRLRDPGLADAPLEVGSPVVVEWRALTVALLDRVADRVRAQLSGPDGQPLSLAAILEGGTWAAGRALAYERRGGEPPLRIVSDGTVF